jgi:hypothetical protein
MYYKLLLYCFAKTEEVLGIAVLSRSYRYSFLIEEGYNLQGTGFWK